MFSEKQEHLHGQKNNKTLTVLWLSQEVRNIIEYPCCVVEINLIGFPVLYKVLKSKIIFYLFIYTFKFWHFCILL